MTVLLQHLMHYTGDSCFRLFLSVCMFLCVYVCVCVGLVRGDKPQGPGPDGGGAPGSVGGDYELINLQGKISAGQKGKQWQ